MRPKETRRDRNSLAVEGRDTIQNTEKNQASKGTHILSSAEGGTTGQVKTSMESERATGDSRTAERGGRDRSGRGKKQSE
jgi:hypothetical protein